MYNFPIGVMLHSFRLSDKEALKAAADLGAQGIQINCTGGSLNVDTVTKEYAREFLKMVKDHGLVISAVCGDFICGNREYNFHNPETSKFVVEKSKRILDLAQEMDVNIVTTHAGVIPLDKNCEKYKRTQASCFELATYADSMNAHFAIETGPEIATTLKAFLDDLHSTGVAVNLDPANFVMVTGDDPVQAVYTLKDYIVHTHAKDGRRLIIEDPEVVYGEIEAEIQKGRLFEELPLGDGDVDFKNYLKALDEIGYKGFLTIEREVGENPSADITKAVNFLNDLKK